MRDLIEHLSSFSLSPASFSYIRGVPAAVDLAAMRDAIQRLGGDVDAINPLVPADLVIDHSIQVDFSRGPDALVKNEEMEFQRNHERFAFLKWAATSFSNMLIVPPGSGIVHQVWQAMEKKGSNQMK